MFSKLFIAAAMVAMVSAASPSGTYKGTKSVLGSDRGRYRHDRGRLPHELGDRGSDQFEM